MRAPSTVHARTASTARKLRASLVASAFFACCCNSPAPVPSPPEAPSTPATVPPPAPIPSTPSTTLTGTVRATNDGVIVPGASVSLAVSFPFPEAVPTATTTTDANGYFSLTYQRQTSAQYMRITVSAPGHVTRSAVVEAGKTREANVDLFREDASFHLTDFRMIARGGVFTYGVYRPLARVTRPLTLYVATNDPQGRQVEARRIDLVIDTVLASAASLSGGTVSITGVERGPMRAGQSGYLTIQWSTFSPTSGLCVTSWSPGGDKPEVSLASTECRCGGYDIDPGIVRHGLANALGLYDTSFSGDLMQSNMVADPPRWRGQNSCDRKPTLAEQRYARYLYARPHGNTDPDNDPPLAVLP